MLETRTDSQRRKEKTITQIMSNLNLSHVFQGPLFRIGEPIGSRHVFVQSDISHSNAVEIYAETDASTRCTNEAYKDVSTRRVQGVSFKVLHLR